ncbi:MAG: DUF975 family protein [Ruminococcus sp.]|nr:DUF975 family protein [Ruminococcus sp.]
MKLKQLTAYSDKLLKGKRMKALLVCLSYLGAALFFRLTEGALYSIMLYFNAVSPAGLFTGESLPQQVISLLLTLMCCLTTAPLAYAAVYWYYQLCSENRDEPQLSSVILNPHIYGRSLFALLMSKLMGAIFLAPAAVFGVTAFRLIKSGMENSAELHLFMAVHAAVMTILSLALWIRTKLAMAAVPYLLIRFPERSVFRVIRSSFGFMKGRRFELIKIFIGCSAPMLLIVTIPFLLPKLFAAVSLFISISFKEDEYLDRNKTYCRLEQANSSAKLPAWTKRRFTPPSDTAQTAGYGDNT